MFLVIVFIIVLLFIMSIFIVFLMIVFIIVLLFTMSIITVVLIFVMVFDFSETSIERGRCDVWLLLKQMVIQITKDTCVTYVSPS